MCVYIYILPISRISDPAQKFNWCRISHPPQENTPNHPRYSTILVLKPTVFGVRDCKKPLFFATAKGAVTCETMN